MKRWKDGEMKRCKDEKMERWKDGKMERQIPGYLKIYLGSALKTINFIYMLIVDTYSKQKYYETNDETN